MGKNKEQKTQEKETYRRISVRFSETEQKDLFGSCELTGHQLVNAVRKALELPEISKQTDKSELLKELGLTSDATNKDVINALRKQRDEARGKK